MMKKSEPSELDQMIARAIDAGTLDSEGAFTLAADAALEKLASFQLGRNSAWILKIVQAAVALNARSMKIIQSTDGTGFVLEAPDMFELPDFERALLATEVVLDGGLGHLAVGLRAVGFGDKRPFTLALEENGERTLFHSDGKKFSKSTKPIDRAARARIQIGVAFPAEDRGRSLGGLKRSAGRAMAEYDEVVNFAETCPIPLTFDGRRVDTMDAVSRFAQDSSCARLSVGWTSLHDPADTPPFLLPQGLALQDSTASIKEKLSDKFTDKRIFFFDGDLSQTRAKMMTKVNYYYKVLHHRSNHKSFEFQSIPRQSYCCWVSDGVIIQKDHIPWTASPVTCDVYLSAEGMEKDLSGMKLGSPEEKQRRFEAVRGQLNFQIENTMANIDQHVPRPFGLHTAIYGVLGVASVAAAPFTFGKSLWGVFGVVGLALSASDKRQIMTDCKSRLRNFSDRLRFPVRLEQPARKF